MRAALFDVGDTLVEHWAPDIDARTRAVLVARFGERPWYDAYLAARDRLDPESSTEARQDTLGVLRAWFAEAGHEPDVELDALRQAMVLPLADISVPVRGAAEALRWCHARGLRVVLVTNTFTRGDAEVLADWSSAGLGDVIAGVVSSHSVGWRKPHRAMFERALAVAEARPDEAFMVGDSRAADIAGAKALGLRAIWRRTPRDEALPYDGPPPDAELEDLAGLPAVVSPWLAP